MRVLAAAIALMLATPVAAQEAAEWRPVTAETGQIRDLAGLEQLALDFLDSGSVRLRLLNAQLEAGDHTAVLASLAWLKARGYLFGEAAQQQLPELVGAAHADPVRALLIPKVEAITASELVETIPAEAGLVEGLYVAEGGEVMLATSITGNTLHQLGPKGSWITGAIPGANDLSGIVAEPDQSLGWIASANLDGSPDDAALFTGLIGLTGDLDNPVLVSAPEGVAVSDLAISRDATVYASDPLGGGIYRKPIAATALATLVEPGTFRSPQGLALSADERLLYVSDYRYGIAIVDLVSGAVERLESDVPAILDGVDGLWLHEGRLVAIQNGTAPIRISAFTLSEDGRRVVAATILEQGHPAWTEPLGGSISGGALYFIAHGHWDRFENGVPNRSQSRWAEAAPEGRSLL